MLNLEETKRLMGRAEVSDKEAKTARDYCYELASILLEAWEEHEANQAKKSKQGEG